MNLTEDANAYLTGHMLDGHIVLPSAACLIMVWQKFAKIKYCKCEEMPAVMEDIVFHHAIILPSDETATTLFVKILNSGCFEIVADGSLAASGKISMPENVELEQIPLDPHELNESEILMQSDDIYKELRARGYGYTGEFCGVMESDLDAQSGKLRWQNNWTTFVDTMLQFHILGKNTREVFVPTRIERVVIDPLKHQKILDDLQQCDVDHLPVCMYKDINIIKSGGIEVRGLLVTMSTRRSHISTPILERCTFVPLLNGDAYLSKSRERARIHAISVATFLAIENSGGALNIKVADVIESKLMDHSLALIIQRAIDSEPSLSSDVTIITNESPESNAQSIDAKMHVVAGDPAMGPVESNCHLVIGYDVVNRQNTVVILQNLIASIRADGFMLLEELATGYDETKAIKLFAHLNLTIVSVQIYDDKKLILIRRIADIAARNKVIISITDQNYRWIEQLQSSLATAESEQRYVYIIGEGKMLLGAIGLINCIKYENGGKLARLIFIQDKQLAKFSFTQKMYVDELNKDLICNVFRNGVWGTFRHFRLDSNEVESKRPVRHAYANTLIKGDLPSISWIQGPSNYSNSIDRRTMEMCTVYYAPINLHDVMLSTGQLAASHNCQLGLEFSGRDAAGRRKAILF